MFFLNSAFTKSSYLQKIKYFIQKIKENVDTKNADKLFEETLSEIGDKTWQD